MARPRTALEAAQAELSAAMAPVPQDFLSDFTPQTALLYAWETAKAALEVLTGALASLQASPEDEAPAGTEALNGATLALAGLTHALVALDVLPPEAEQALAAPTASA